MQLRIWIALVVLNSVWAANPIAAKILLRTFVPTQVAWIRYTSAIIGLAVLAPFLRWRGIALWKWPQTLRLKLLVLATGILPFFFGPLLTLHGLAGTQASEAALIVALEPLWSVVLAWLILKEKISPIQRFAFLVATFGFLLLSLGGEHATAASGWREHLFFNFLLLLAQAAEAGYSIAGKPALKKIPPGALFAMALVSGWVLLTLWVLATTGVRDVLVANHWGPSEFAAAFWLGALGSTLGYLVWAFALGQVTVAALAMTLFVQPIGGALLGVLGWGEHLTSQQGFGALFILMGIALPLKLKK